jgi:hypothetical protein
MPTGYTAGILDGEIKTFPQFAKNCMRAFGATIHMRDEPLEKEYEPRVPSDYYSKNVSEKKTQISEYKTLSDKEIIAKEKQRLEEGKNYHLKSIKTTKANKKRLVKILKEAREFIPPTAEHNEFKKFMIEQLESTIDFDCSTKYHDEALIEIEKTLANMNAARLRKMVIEEMEKSLSYYIEEEAKEIKRCNDSNKWVNQVFESLKNVQ